MQTSPKIAHTGPPATAAAAAAHDEVLARHYEALRAHRDAIDTLGAARQKRAAEVRAAAEQGKPLPSSAAIEKAEQAVASAAERVQETRAIVVGKGRSVARAVAAEAGVWRSGLDDAQVAALDRLDRAGVEFDEALTAVAEYLGVRTWIERCERVVNDPVASVDLPGFPPEETVLAGHDPRPAIERVMSWLVGKIVTHGTEADAA